MRPDAGGKREPRQIDYSREVEEKLHAIARDLERGPLFPNYSIPANSGQGLTIISEEVPPLIDVFKGDLLLVEREQMLDQVAELYGALAKAELFPNWREGAGETFTHFLSVTGYAHGPHLVFRDFVDLLENRSLGPPDRDGFASALLRQLDVFLAGRGVLEADRSKLSAYFQKRLAEHDFNVPEIQTRSQPPARPGAGKILSVVAAIGLTGALAYLLGPQILHHYNELSQVVAQTEVQEASMKLPVILTLLLLAARIKGSHPPEQSNASAGTGLGDLPQTDEQSAAGGVTPISQAENAEGRVVEGTTWPGRLNDLHANLVQDLLNELGVLGDKEITIVDFGIGDEGAPTTFDLVDRLLAAGFRRFTLIGLDSNSTHINHAKMKRDRRSFPPGVKVIFQLIDEDAPRIGVRNADRILAANVYVHYDSAKRKVLQKRLISALGPRGKLIIAAVPFPDWPTSMEVYDKDDNLLEHSALLSGRRIIGGEETDSRVTPERPLRKILPKMPSPATMISSEEISAVARRDVLRYIHRHRKAFQPAAIVINPPVLAEDVSLVDFGQKGVIDAESPFRYLQTVRLASCLAITMHSSSMNKSNLLHEPPGTHLEGDLKSGLDDFSDGNPVDVRIFVTKDFDPLLLIEAVNILVDDSQVRLWEITVEPDALADPAGIEVGLDEQGHVSRLGVVGSVFPKSVSPLPGFTAARPPVGGAAPASLAYWVARAAGKSHEEALGLANHWFVGYRTEAVLGAGIAFLSVLHPMVLGVPLILLPVFFWLAHLVAMKIAQKRGYIDSWPGSWALAGVLFAYILPRLAALIITHFLPLPNEIVQPVALGVAALLSVVIARGHVAYDSWLFAEPQMESSAENAFDQAMLKRLAARFADPKGRVTKAVQNLSDTLQANGELSNEQINAFGEAAVNSLDELNTREGEALFFAFGSVVDRFRINLNRNNYPGMGQAAYEQMAKRVLFELSICLAVLRELPDVKLIKGNFDLMDLMRSHPSWTDWVSPQVERDISKFADLLRASRTGDDWDDAMERGHGLIKSFEGPMEIDQLLKALTSLIYEFQEQVRTQKESGDPERILAEGRLKVCQSLIAEAQARVLETVANLVMPGVDPAMGSNNKAVRSLLGQRGVLESIFDEDDMTDAQREEWIDRFLSSPIYAPFVELLGDPARSDRVRTEVSKRMQEMGSLMDHAWASQQVSEVLKTEGVDEEVMMADLTKKLLSRSALVPEVALTKIYQNLKFQLFPDEMPVYRGVNPNYAGFGGERGSESDWGEGPKGLRVARDYARQKPGRIIIESTFGELRRFGIIVQDEWAVHQPAVTLIHFDPSRPVPFRTFVAPISASDAEEEISPAPPAAKPPTQGNSESIDTGPDSFGQGRKGMTPEKSEGLPAPKDLSAQAPTGPIRTMQLFTFNGQTYRTEDPQVGGHWSASRETAPGQWHMVLGQMFHEDEIRRNRLPSPAARLPERKGKGSGDGQGGATTGGEESGRPSANDGQAGSNATFSGLKEVAQSVKTWFETLDLSPSSLAALMSLGSLIPLALAFILSLHGLTLATLLAGILLALMTVKVAAVDRILDQRLMAEGTSRRFHISVARLGDVLRGASPTATPDQIDDPYVPKTISGVAETRGELTGGKQTPFLFAA